MFTCADRSSAPQTGGLRTDEPVNMATCNNPAQPAKKMHATYRPGAIGRGCVIDEGKMATS